MSFPVSKTQRRNTVESGSFLTPVDKSSVTTSSAPNLIDKLNSTPSSCGSNIGGLGRTNLFNLFSKSVEDNLPDKANTVIKFSKSSLARSRDSIMTSSQESLNTVSLSTPVTKDTITTSNIGDTDHERSETPDGQRTLTHQDKVILEEDDDGRLSPFLSANESSNNNSDDKDNQQDTTSAESQEGTPINGIKSDAVDQANDIDHTRERSFERSLDNIMDKCSEKSLDLNLSVDSWNGSVSDTSLRSPDQSTSSYGTKLSKGDKKRKPKSSWYTMLSPTYKSRSEDYHKIFKDVPKDERLVVDYSCALQKDILVQGRMYISQKWICFYANIFRWETVLCIPCSEITAITKEKTARVIPNAIQITTEKEKYFFTSFGARDKTYMMLFRLWQNALLSEFIEQCVWVARMAVRYNPIRKGESNEIHQIFFGFDRPSFGENNAKPMNPKEQWQWIHYSYGEELGLTSSDEDYVAPPGMDDLIMKDKLSSPEMPPVKELTDSSDLHGTSEMLTMASNDEDPIPSDEVFSQPGLSLESPLPLNVTTEIPTDFGDTTEDSEGEVACSGHDHLEKLYVDEVFNMNIDKMFTLLFTDTPFYRIFVESRKTFDLDIPSWGEEVDEDGNRVRTIHYTLSLNHSIGPKTSPSSERQTCYKQSKPGIIYVVDCQCENNGIPYADSFFVVTQYCLTRVTKEKCRLRVTGEIKYRKSVMGIVKSMIDRSAVGGLTDYFRDLAVHLRREVEENEKLLGHTIAKKKLRKRRKPTTTTSEPLVTSRQTDRQISSPPSPHRNPKEETSVLLTADSLVRIICVILLFLVLCNAVLYYKLWSLEHYTSNIYSSNSAQILDNLAKYPESREEWFKLLKQQQLLHDSEIDKWREVLSASIVLVDQMKGTLVHLHDSLEGRLKSATTDRKPNS